ncbi:hypothetical protein [Synechococcus sp. MIT S9510]
MNSKRCFALPIQIKPSEESIRVMPLADFRSARSRVTPATEHDNRVSR